MSDALLSQARLLMVSAFFSSHGGGIEVVAGQLARVLASDEIQIHWVAGGEGNKKIENNSQADLTVEHATSFDFLEKRLGLPMPIWNFKSLKNMWGKISYVDVIFVHDYLYFSSLVAIFFAFLKNKPVLLTQHIGEIKFKSKIARNLLNVLNKTIGRFVLSYVDQVVFVGKPVMNYFKGFVNFRVMPRMIANGVDHSIFRPIPRSLNLDQPVRLLFVGRFVEKKGIALLENCMDLPMLQWTFIGWGPLSPRNWPSLPSNACVFENLRASQLIPYFQEADLLVLPSTGEGFPLVLQEALACGTPVLVSSEVAHAFPEIDTNCVFDVDLDVENPEFALKNAVKRVTADRFHLMSARECAVKLAQQWSWTKCAEEYKILFKNISDNKDA